MRGETRPVVAITGAAGGIGQALARRFADAGYRLALAELDAPRLESFAETLRREGYEVHLTVLDVRDQAAQEAWAASIEAELGRVDVLINNAGTITWGIFTNMSPEEIDLVLDVNLRGVMYGCRAFAAALERSQGHIVNVGSMSGLFASPYQTTYNASKWALRGFTQALRMELRPRKVGVSCVMPGTIATDFMARAQSHDEEESAKLASGMKRFGASPDRVARKTLRAVRWNFGEQLVGLDAYAVAFTQRFLPGLMTFLFNRFYPYFDPGERAEP